MKYYKISNKEIAIWDKSLPAPLTVEEEGWIPVKGDPAKVLLEDYLGDKPELELYMEFRSAFSSKRHQTPVLLEEQEVGDWIEAYEQALEDAKWAQEDEE